MNKDLGTVLVPQTGTLTLMAGSVRMTLTVRGELSAPASDLRTPSGWGGGAATLTATAVLLAAALSGAVSSPAAAESAVGKPSALASVRTIDLGADVAVDGTADAFIAEHKS